MEDKVELLDKLLKLDTEFMKKQLSVDIEEDMIYLDNFVKEREEIVKSIDFYGLRGVLTKVQVDYYMDMFKHNNKNIVNIMKEIQRDILKKQNALNTKNPFTNNYSVQSKNSVFIDETK